MKKNRIVVGNFGIEAIFVITFFFNSFAAEKLQDLSLLKRESLDPERSRKWLIKDRDKDGMVQLDRDKSFLKDQKKEPCPLLIYDNQQKILSLILCGLKEKTTQSICHRMAYLFSCNDICRAKRIIYTIKMNIFKASNFRNSLSLYFFLPETTEQDIGSAIGYVCIYYQGWGKPRKMPLVISEKYEEIERIPIFIKKMLFAPRNGYRRDAVTICDKGDDPSAKRLPCYLLNAEDLEGSYTEPLEGTKDKFPYWYENETDEKHA